MAKFCTYCGCALEENASVCKACGVKLESEAVEDTSVQPEPEVVAPVENASEPQKNEAPETVECKACAPEAPTGRYAVAKTSAFFWYSLLFSLPFVGFITSLIFSFAARKYNIRNFARSILIWYIIGIVVPFILVIFLVIIALLFPEVSGTFEDILNQYSYLF